MELAADEPWMLALGQLDHFAQRIALGRNAGNDQPGLFQARQIGVIDFIAVAMALGNHVLPINLARQRTFLETALLAAKAHRAAEVGIRIALLDPAFAVAPFGNQRNHRVRIGSVKLGAVRARKTSDIAGELDHRELHAQAYAQVRHLVFPRIANRRNLAFGAAPAKTARHQDGIHCRQRIAAVLFQRFGINVMHLDPAARVDARMHQRFSQRLIGFGEIDIFANEGDIHFVLRVFQRIDQLVPHGKVGRLGQNAQLVADDFIQHLVMQHRGNLVNAVGIQRGDHRFRLHIGKQRNFRALIRRQRPIGTAQQNVRLNADLPQFLDRMLGRLGFEFARRRNPGHQREMDVARVVAPFLYAHLANRFEKGQRFDVAHRAANLDNRHVGTFRAALDVLFYLIRYMRNYLNSLSQVLATTFFFNNRLVNLTGGEIIALAHFCAGEALVMTKIQIGFGTVVGDKHLAMLERRHGAGIDVDIGIELEMGDLDAARFENRPQAGGSDALAQTGHDTARDENVFSHENAGAGNSNDSGNYRLERKPASGRPAAAEPISATCDRRCRRTASGCSGHLLHQRGKIAE